MRLRWFPVIAIIVAILIVLGTYIIYKFDLINLKDFVTWTITGVIVEMFGIIIGYLFAERGHPKLRIENPRVETRIGYDLVDALSIADSLFKSEPKKVESKVVHFDIHNVGRKGAYNIEARIKINGLFNDFRTLIVNSRKREQTFDLNPDDKLSVTICVLEEKQSIINLNLPSVMWSNLNEQRPEIGKKRLLEIRFLGKDFLDKRVWKLQLDATSYEKLNLSL